MKKIRTRHFLRCLYTSLGISAVFLLWLLVFGKGMAQEHFASVSSVVFAFLALSAICLLTFCFVPYFKGDKRWFAIPSLLTLVFFMGTAILWQVPVGTVGA
ncbi:MAG: hypothetical protein IJW30_01295 [Clostridia bacterium]|nr:hypothetical protein [Clostridia bacterium]